MTGLDLRAPKSTTLRVRGHAFHFLEAGQGPPVLAIHGLAASSHVFAPLVALASNRFRFLLVDLPSSGKSGPFASLDPRKLADDFAALVHELGAEPTYVLGHSFGGLIALELLARHPAVVKGLLLASPPALGISSLKSWISSPITERVWSQLSRVQVSAGAIQTYLRYMWGAKDKKGVTPDLVRNYLAAISAEGFHAGQLDALKRIAEYRFPLEAIARTTQPRELLWGERDRLIPATYGEQVARSLGVSLTLIPECGHFIPEEHPEILARALSDMAKARTPRTPKGKRPPRRARS